MNAMNLTAAAGPSANRLPIADSRRPIAFQQMEVHGMHTVELLDEALGAARRLGYDVRQDWLGGDGGGHCLVRGRRLLLLDVAQSPDEQLDIVVEALRSE